MDRGEKKRRGSIAVIGAGFSGAVIARELATKGYRIEVFDARPHVAGNCYTARDNRTNIMMHVYGPHIFHTNNEMVWNYIRQYGSFMPFTNRVKGIHDGRIYSLPINLHTINQFFGRCLSPAEAREFLANLCDKSIENPATFEDQALRYIGNDLYKAFFEGYTQKQWGVHPSLLPASIIKRLPVRFNYNDNYYSSSYQGMPKDGYTKIVENILSHSNIIVRLSTNFVQEEKKLFDHVFYSGPIDAWFQFSEGKLDYRTLKFEIEFYEGDFQGNAVINYCDQEIPWTRITEHKHFSPWESHGQTVISREFSRHCTGVDTPYYPIRLLKDKKVLSRYIERAKNESGVTFIGRLGTYRYIDMHIAIEEALNTAQKFFEHDKQGLSMPAFTVEPI